MKGFYINLEKRKDRKEKMEKLQSKYLFFNGIKRFNAISNQNGKIGCYLSHIQCLELCLQMEDEYFLIIEDDFHIINDNDYINFIKDFNDIKEKKEWDIFLFTPVHSKRLKRKKFFKNFYVTTNSQTTTGYIIRKSFIPILLINFKEGLEKYLKTKKEIYCIDIHWKIVQQNYTFIYYLKTFVIQYPNYSDIEKKNVYYCSFK